MAPNIAETTATPSIPLPLSFNMFLEFIPPIATLGIFTASHMDFNVSYERIPTSFFVEVSNTAPKPI